LENPIKFARRLIQKGAPGEPLFDYGSPSLQAAYQRLTLISGRRSKTMRPETSSPRSGVFSLALILGACLCPTSTVAEDSASNAQNNANRIVASHILDGKAFIGPTGEKGKKVHHEDILRFSDGKFTSSECFQYGFKGTLKK
jgi:hypothetical protein